MFCCSSFFLILSLIKIKVVDFTLLLWSADAFTEKCHYNHEKKSVKISFRSVSTRSYIVTLLPTLNKFYKHKQTSIF